MTRSYGVQSDAEAVVAEALALERETLWETAELTGRRDGPLGDREQVNALWKAVVAVRDLATSMQNPLRDSPYSGLGEKVADEATGILVTIRNAVKEDTLIVDDD